jgi:hypothetical protein
VNNRFQSARFPACKSKNVGLKNKIRRFSYLGMVKVVVNTHVALGRFVCCVTLPREKMRIDERKTSRRCLLCFRTD